MRSGKRTTRPLRKTTSIINGRVASGLAAGGGNATWSAISTGAKQICLPETVDRLPDRTCFRQPCS